MTPLREAIRGRSEGDPFLVLWHRAGNDAAGIAAAARAAREGPPALEGRPLRHGVECDLKWAPDLGGRPHLFLWHGPTGLERLTAAEARRREDAGAPGMISLERALDLDAARDLDFMVEVKRGHGPREAALEACAAAFARRGRAGRLLLAASALPVLEDARRLLPETATLLFASHVTRGGRVLHVPKMDLRRALPRGLLLGSASLGAVDALSPLGLLGRSRPRLGGMPASIPRAASAGEAREFAALRLRGAFAYFGPAPL